jgi:hypothetical protein
MPVRLNFCSICWRGILLIPPAPGAGGTSSSGASQTDLSSAPNFYSPAVTTRRSPIAIESRSIDPAASSIAQ